MSNTDTVIDQEHEVEDFKPQSTTWYNIIETSGRVFIRTVEKDGSTSTSLIAIRDTK